LKLLDVFGSDELAKVFRFQFTFLLVDRNPDILLMKDVQQNYVIKENIYSVHDSKFNVFLKRIVKFEFFLINI